MWYNPIIERLLKSPLQFLISGSIMLITYRGRKSGRQFTTPISYLKVNDTLMTISSRERVWWRNLRNGGDATLRLRGSEVAARADVIEDRVHVAQALLGYFRHAPGRSKSFGVKLNAEGTPEMAAIQRLAEEKVVVKFTPDKPDA